MRRLWIFFFAVSFLQAEDLWYRLPAGWHMATHEERNAEYVRELEAMRRVGTCCDPPISMGSYEAHWGRPGSAGVAWGELPSASVDSEGRFRTQYFMDLDGKRYELTYAQFDSRWKKTRRDGFRRINAARALELMNQARAGKLPRSPNESGGSK